MLSVHFPVAGKNDADVSRRSNTVNSLQPNNVTRLISVSVKSDSSSTHHKALVSQPHALVAVQTATTASSYVF
jgi:hypothetical protein